MKKILVAIDPQDWDIIANDCIPDNMVHLLESVVHLGEKLHVVHFANGDNMQDETFIADEDGPYINEVTVDYDHLQNGCCPSCWEGNEDLENSRVCTNCGFNIDWSGRQILMWLKNGSPKGA